VSEGTQGVYASAVVEELTDTDLDRCIVIFSHRSEAHGAGEWTPEDVRPLGFARTGRRIGAPRARSAEPADTGERVSCDDRTTAAEAASS
jgi:hypothetical protein